MFKFLQRWRSAQFARGLAHENGRGGPVDFAKARRCYWWAAVAGHRAAQFNLGGLYYNGRGGPVDYGRARCWWERAAAGYRLYDEGDVARVAKIRLLQRAGLALKEVARLLDCLGPAPLCDELRAQLRACRAENRARLAQLAETEALLARLLGESPAGA